MIDPITALSAASVCYTTLKKAVAVGKDVEEIYKTLSKWAGHIEDVKEVAKPIESIEPKKPEENKFPFVGVTIALVLLAALGSVAPTSFMNHFTVFVLSCFG